MKFLLDQNAGRRFAAHLRSLGHDVTVISLHYTGGLLDPAVLSLAHQEGRIIITNDTDFGELVVRRNLPHAGVILFRVRAADFATRRERLDFVLANYADQLDQLIVVTLTRVRVRRTRQPPADD